MTGQNKSVSEQAKCAVCKGAGYTLPLGVEYTEPCDRCQGTGIAPRVPAAAMVMQPVDERALSGLTIYKFAKAYAGHPDHCIGEFVRLSEVRAALSAGPTQAAELGVCCYGGPLKPKSACASCAAWSPVAPAAEQTASTSIDRDSVLQLLNHIEDVLDEANWEKISVKLWNAVTTQCRAQAPSQDAPAAQDVCARCSGHEIIYFEDAQRPCPDCQDLSDYDGDAVPAAQAVERAAPIDAKAICDIADELALEASAYEGDFADTVNGCADALHHLVAAAPAVEPINPDAVRIAKRQMADSKLAGPGANAHERYLHVELEVLQRAVIRSQSAPAGTEPTQAARDVLADDAGAAQSAGESLETRMDASSRVLADGCKSSTMVSDFYGPKITIRYATSAQADAAHDVLCKLIDRASAKGGEA